MSVLNKSLVFTSQGLLPINLLSTDGLISFCNKYDNINVNIDIESFNNKSNVSKIINLGEQPLIKIVVKNNYYIAGTLEQNVLVTDKDVINDFNDCQWKNLNNININDKCVIKKRYSVSSKNNLIHKKETNTLSSLDRIVESSQILQLSYLQKLFDKYAQINDVIELDLSNFSDDEQQQIRCLLLQFGIICILEHNKIIINEYIAEFKNLIGFSNKKQEILNNLSINEINNNLYTVLPVIDKHVVKEQETFQLVINDIYKSFIVNGFIVQSI